MSYTKTTWVNNTTPINETNLNKIESGIENNDINIGEENYDNTRTYEVGDIVRYNEKIYKCITAITTAENFDNSKWEQTNIVEIVQSEKSKIYDLIEALSTPIVGEGENITLNDTAEKRFENFDIEGNSEQATRSGKNKLNTLYQHNAGDVVTSNGITFTFNKDGSIKIQGTATSNAYVMLYGELNTYATTMFTLPSIFTVSGGVTYPISILGRVKTTGTYQELRTASGGTEYGNVFVQIASGQTVNTTIYPQIEEGSTATPYEQYGVSPSPDYPSEVISCGDNINEFDKDNANIKNWYIDTSNKKIASGNSENRILIQEIKPNTTYTISKKLSTFIVATCTNMPTLNSSTTQAQRNDNATKIAIASGSSDKYLVVQFKTQADTLTEQEILNSIKIVEGTETGEYSPYGQGCINETICNKNFFDKDTISENTALDSTTGTTVANNYRVTSDYIRVKENTNYKFSNASDISTNGKALCFYDSNKEYISGMELPALPNGVLTTPANTKYIRFGYVNTRDYTNLMLEEGSTATTYIEHQSQSYTIPTQQPMRAIGDTRDKFILKENGKWYERHNIEEVILTGDENWSQRNQGDGTNTITFNFNLLNVGAYGSDNVLCDKFVYEQNSSSGNEGIGFESTLVTQYIQINRNRLSSLNLAGFKAWLSNNNTKLYYVLETPEDIECTSEQTEILNQMYIKAKSYKGVTHIYSNDEVSPNCYVEAVKDLTTLIQ